MAIGDAYATAAIYRGIVTSSSSADDTEIDSQLMAVSRYLDRKLGRFFTKDASAVARTYPVDEFGIWTNGSLITRLRVDDIAVAPTSVKVDEDRNGSFERTLLTSEYELAPLNAPKGPEPGPYLRIDLIGTGTYTSWLPGSLVEVTAQFGWPSVPGAIVQATCQLVGILRLDSPRATNQMSQGFDTVVGSSDEAQAIVENLQRLYAKRWVFA